MDEVKKTNGDHLPAKTGFVHVNLKISKGNVPYIATITVLCESDNPAFSWSILSVHVGEAFGAQDATEWVDQQHGEAPRERSRE